MLKLNDKTCIRVISTPNTALFKLKRANIAVYSCLKRGASFIFYVKDKDIEKAFAIFKNPCYNVTIVKHSKRFLYLSTLKLRSGLIVGFTAFLALVFLSNLCVLKISITGSGKYLSNEIKRILYSAGVEEFGLYKNVDLSLATGQILALPDVTFCDIKKRGSALCVDVEVEREEYSTPLKKELVSDIDGVLKNIVAICGSECLTVGSAVRAGDVLISSNGGGIVVGYAEVEYSGSVEYSAESDTDENLKGAYASLQLLGDSIVERSHTVKIKDEGVTYVVDYTAIRKLTINMG
jgi:hypothetical protein